MLFRDLLTDQMLPNWGYILSLPQFNQMLTTPQLDNNGNQTNLAVHTQLVTERMLEYLTDDIVADKESNYYIIMLMAAIFHDIGKIERTTFDDNLGCYVSKRHNIAGERLIRQLFFDEDLEKREKVCYMIRHHHDLNQVNEDKTLFADVIKNANGLVPLRDMVALFKCDMRHSHLQGDENNFFDSKIPKIIQASKLLNCYLKPYIHDTRRHKFQDFYDTTNIPSLSLQQEFKVYIMIGLPGSGKDEWIKKNLPNLPNITINQNEKIFEEKIIDLCEKRESFIINGDNLKIKDRKKFHNIILNYNPYIVYIVVEAPTLKINKTRKKGEIKPSVLGQKLKTFEYPEYYEYDEIKVVKEK